MSDYRARALVNGCPKLAYRTKGDAKRAVRQIQTSHGGGEGVHYYRCPPCGAWHWTREAQRRG